jgi:UMF1 family MFS transporter
MTPKREILSWALYDFANSAFATSVLGVVFQVYYTTAVVGPGGYQIGGLNVPAMSLWGYGVALAMVVVGLAAPALGAIADFTARKKAFLRVFWLVSCLFTGLLFFVTPGRVLLGLFLLMVAMIGFSGGNAFYNAFLPELADPKTMGRVSGLGQSLGYVGGGLCLLLNLWMIRSPGWFGLADVNHLPVRVCMVVVAAWFLLFGLPMLLFVRERSQPRALPEGKGCLAAGYGQVLHTLRNVRRYPELTRFLVAFLFFIEGVETIIVMGAAFGANVLGMPQEELVRCFLLIQAVAIFGSLLFGVLADRWSNKAAIMASLVVWIALVASAYFIQTPGQYWALGVGIGAVLGGTQACSRSLIAVLAPERQRAEIFGFFAMSGKAASAIGPLVTAVVTQLFGERTGVLSVVVFFIIGLAILWPVDESKGIREAENMA